MVRSPEYREKNQKRRSRDSGLFLARFGSGFGSGFVVRLWVYARPYFDPTIQKWLLISQQRTARRPLEDPTGYLG